MVSSINSVTVGAMSMMCGSTEVVTAALTILQTFPPECDLLLKMVATFDTLNALITNLREGIHLSFEIIYLVSAPHLASKLCIQEVFLIFYFIFIQSNWINANILSVLLFLNYVLFCSFFRFILNCLRFEYSHVSQR